MESIAIGGVAIYVDRDKFELFNDKFGIHHG